MDLQHVGMSGDKLEQKLRGWSIGPGTTEQERCDNAESVIRNAINAHATLSSKNISIFTKGSFKNKTNIPKSSDVDVCVRLNSVFYGEFPEGKTQEDLGYGDGNTPTMNLKSRFMQH